MTILGIHQQDLNAALTGLMFQLPTVESQNSEHDAQATRGRSTGRT